MLTKAQFGKYRAAWAAACAAQGWIGVTEIEARRDALHQLLQRQHRVPMSRKDWTNRHFDLFLAECAKLTGQPAGASLTPATGERRRLLWRIREDAKAANLTDAYLAKLSSDLHGIGCWDELANADLENFRNRIHQISRKKQSGGPHAGRVREAASPPPQPTPRPRATVIAHVPADDDNMPF